jgi:pimeloyl-ACP methyl ester carboxylesterase
VPSSSLEVERVMGVLKAICSRAQIAVFIAVVAVGGCARATSSGVSTLASPAGQSSRRAVGRSAIPCAKLSTLRQLRGQLSVVKNPSTGDSVEYLVVGDGAVSDDLIIMFPGTGQIIPGWPMQLFTNKTYSPNIAGTLGYEASEDGAVSLCHNYRLLFIDYPGVGKTPYRADLTRDEISNDVDAVLQNVAAVFGINTNLVDPLGWSLGTTMALKYAFLSPVARPSRVIHNLVLVATGPGGSLQGQETHDSAACVKTLFDDSITYSGPVGWQIKADLSELIFPYKGQTASENGSKSNCTATVGSTGVNLSVQLDCTALNICEPYLRGALLDMATYPWILSGGIGPKVYSEERAIASDWYENYCARAGPHFVSLNCSRYGTVDISPTNGGVCMTDTRDPDHPIAQNCDRIRLTGKITVIVGYEDLLDQWAYGQAVVDGYRRSQGAGAASLVVYPGSAGHGIMIQHPKWTQEQINAAIR